MGTTTSTTDDPYRTAPSPANWFGGTGGVPQTVALPGGMTGYSATPGLGASPLAGRINAPAPPGLPPQITPGYQPPMPAPITPNAPWNTGSPATANYNNRPPQAPQAWQGQQYDPLTLQPLAANDPRRVGSGVNLGFTQTSPGVYAPSNVDPGMVRRPDQMPQGDGSYAGQILGHEGVGKNPRSSAAGYGGFIDSTWQAFAQANPQLFQGMSPEQIMAARNNPQIARMAIDWYARQNAGFLAQRGIPATGQALGIAHYLGPAGAARVMQASDETPVRSLVDPAAVAANPELGYMTVGQLKARYANMASPASPDGTASSYTPQQAFLPAEPREFHSWGQPAEGQARHQDLGTIMGRFAPLLLGIASLALRLPLSTAVTAYSAMARAQYNGQEEAYQRSRTQWQDAWDESQARGNMESRDYGDAFAQYGQNNPQGLQQELARLALRYNDPAMLQMAERGDLQGAYQMQQRRDQLLATMGKGNRLIQDQQDQQEVERTLQARMRQWDAANPNATPDERQVAEFNTRTELQDQMAAKTGKGAAKTATGTQAIAQSHLDAADAATRQWVADEKAAGRNPTDDQIKIHRDQELDKALQGGRSGGAQLAPYSGPSTWPGSPNTPPPGDPDITPAVWSQALLLASKGAPVPLGRGVPEAAAIRKAYPVAQAALGIDPSSAADRQLQFAANQAAMTAVSRYFGQGQAATQMRSANTVAGHINLFRQYADALRTGEGGSQTLTQLGQAMAVEMGHPEVTDYRIAATMFADETVRLLTNTGGTRGDRDDMQKEFASYMAQGQLTGAADVAENFLHSRFEGLQNEWVHPPGITQTERQLGERTAQFREMLTPEARELFDRPRRPVAGAPVQPMTEEQYNAAPSGTKYRMPNDPPGTIRVKP